MLATVLRRAHLAVMFALVASVGALAGVPVTDGAAQAPGGVVEYVDLELTLTLPKLTELSQTTSELTTCRGEWHGKLGSSDVRVQMCVIGSDDYELFEPEDVIETWRDTIRDPSGDANEGHNYTFSFEPIRCIAAPAGCTSILAETQATKTRNSGAAQKYAVVLVGSLLPKHGWIVRADVMPPPSADALQAFVAELEKCVTYKGKPCDPKWTDDEAKAYWQRIAPESTWKKFEKPVRTEHFIVLTNSTSPAPFVKKLEGWYATITKVVPVDDLKGRKLLPILLFRTDDDFQNFYRAYYELEPKDNVDDTSVGIGDWVATSCDYTDDYERLVDLCKQAMIVRARAWGGNLWFRSGLREYCATKPKERAAAYKAVKKNRYTSIDKLFDDTAWDQQGDKVEKTGTSDEASYWDQAAMWMEFLHDGPWPKGSFVRFVRTVGTIPQGNHDEVVAAVQSIYGMDLRALEKKWVEYYAKK